MEDDPRTEPRVWPDATTWPGGADQADRSPKLESNTVKLLGQRLSTLQEVEIPKQDHVKSKDEKVIPGGGDICRTHVQKKDPEDKSIERWAAWREHKRSDTQGKTMSQHLRSQKKWPRSRHQGNQGSPIADATQCEWGAPSRWSLLQHCPPESSARRAHRKWALVPRQPEAHAWGGQGKHWGAWRPRASAPRSPAHRSFLNSLSRAGFVPKVRETRGGDRRRARPSPGPQAKLLRPTSTPAEPTD